jgi:hypothetical protein
MSEMFEGEEIPTCDYNHEDEIDQLSSDLIAANATVAVLKRKLTGVIGALRDTANEYDIIKGSTSNSVVNEFRKLADKLENE